MKNVRTVNSIATKVAEILGRETEDFVTVSVNSEIDYNQDARGYYGAFKLIINTDLEEMRDKHPEYELVAQYSDNLVNDTYNMIKDEIGVTDYTVNVKVVSTLLEPSITQHLVVEVRIYDKDICEGLNDKISSVKDIIDEISYTVLEVDNVYLVSSDFGSICDIDKSKHAVTIKLKNGADPWNYSIEGKIISTIYDKVWNMGMDNRPHVFLLPKGDENEYQLTLVIYWRQREEVK